MSFREPYLMRAALVCVFLVPGLSVFAKEVELDDLTGQRVWLKPARAIYLRVDFYKRPNIGAETFHVTTKTTFEVDRVTRNWVRIFFVSSNVDHAGFAYLLTRTVKLGLYTASPDDPDQFDQASFFREDPDLVRARLSAAENDKTVKERHNPASKFFKHTKKLCCAVPQKSSVAPKTPPPESLQK
jgi:hypothetical protein